MAESTLSVAYAELRRRIGRLIGAGRDPTTDFDADDTEDVDDILTQGLRMFYCPPPLPGEKYPHDWSFLTPVTTLTTTEPYDTGTVTIVDGVVTLASGTWPAGAADGELEISGESYTVASRDSDSQLTLDDTSVDEDAGTSYNLIFSTYELPDGFMDLLGPMTYQPGKSDLVGEITLVSEHQIRIWRQNAEWVGRPRHCALRPQSHSGAADGQRFELVLWPVPDDEYILSYRYRIAPDLLTATLTYPPGGMHHSATIVEACLAAAEDMVFNDSNGPHFQRFLHLLAGSVGRDRKLNSPDTLGANMDHSDRPMGEACPYPAGIDHVVQYGGVTYY
jgi:hypothetical protein